MRIPQESARFFRMALAATGLAFVALVFNAYVRISEVDIGCRAWPGCYGVLFAPLVAQDLQVELAPEQQKALEKKRAFQETLQRFIAGGFSLLLMRLTVLGWRLKRRRRAQQIWIPLIAAVLTVALGVVGFLTYDYRYKPLVLMVQLLGGMATLGLLWWIVLREQRLFESATAGPLISNLRPRALLAIALASLQIAIGGWSMVNYAGLACPDFPTCHGQWWPTMDFLDGFTLWRDVGLDYEARLLPLSATTAIHVGHRVGALMVLLYVGWLAAHIIRVGGEHHIRRYGVLMLGLLLAQTALGIAQVLTHLPLILAVAHNAMAALLLAGLVTLYHVLKPPRKL